MKVKDLKIGNRVRVTGYEKGNSEYRTKLLSMGLTRGVEFTLTKIAPMGDPVELEVRGFHLSLRKSEADILIIEEV
ncbi:ferrous iron transport protein A [Thiospirochaeta perfilievii]|uniref:Ferrous iron transport protein A n=1 Tax=Thiospirochaeta perfilievii TaxID=252967 RepID=A0A5C1QBL7_9SPIO|nr:FeoA domain-containing protein [Thiospirochaeta perfilievii]QEN04126.1 ferrous iron transport protein A [Thiospirochaeta perfilievii]